MAAKLEDNAWMERLWTWADKYKVSKKELPRNREKLLDIKHLSFYLVYFGIEERTEEKLDTKKGSPIPFQLIKGYFPKELGKLTQLESLCIIHNFIERLPTNIVNLKNLKKLCLCHNKNLVLTFEQKLWVWELEKKGCIIECDEHLNLNLFVQSLCNSQ